LAPLRNEKLVRGLCSWTPLSPRKQFFFEKRTKKLLLAHPRPVLTLEPPSGVEQGAKVFCFFFSKKKYFLASLLCHTQPGLAA
jgi:hypothetical protein